MSSTLRQLAPHYLAMLAIYLVVVVLVSAFLGQTSFWISLFVALVIALAYPPTIRRLDRAPEAWSR